MSDQTWDFNKLLEQKSYKSRWAAVLRNMFVKGVSKSITDVCDMPLTAETKVAILCVVPWHAIQPAVESTLKRALQTHTPARGMPKVEAWAQGWIDGTDRSEESNCVAWNLAAKAAHDMASDEALKVIDAAMRFEMFSKGCPRLQPVAESWLAEWSEWVAWAADMPAEEEFALQVENFRRYA